MNFLIFESRREKTEGAESAMIFVCVHLSLVSRFTKKGSWCWNIQGKLAIQAKKLFWPCKWSCFFLAQPYKLLFSFLIWSYSWRTNINLNQLPPMASIEIMVQILPILHVDCLCKAGYSRKNCSNLANDCSIFVGVKETNRGLTPINYFFSIKFGAMVGEPISPSINFHHCHPIVAVQTRITLF